MIDHSSLFSLDRKIAVVSGASRGIGRAIARGLGQYGALVIGVGRTPSEELEKDDCFSYRVLNVSDATMFRQLCQEIQKHNGQIGVYVHAAGISLPEAGSRKEDNVRFAKTIDENLVTPFRCIRAVTDCMTTSGSIILISSINAAMGFPDNPGYVAAKGGLSAMGRALAVDLGNRQIRVNSIAPGYVRTSMTEASYNDPLAYEKILRRTILKRWGEPADIVGAAIFLASEASSYVTGQEIVVDGGWSARGL